ncbi:hypothetical protein SACS_1276 [Parasaccharibacter apium]|uniref:Uncharacterized protein n=1 Tax=Parasaccharibacter apium TaxID=1510841 RepID=A0A7U7G6C7_9PROT|nr:hypothetical protein SACS_1276 [Parasaccharibacter apium]
MAVIRASVVPYQKDRSSLSAHPAWAERRGFECITDGIFGI